MNRGGLALSPLSLPEEENTYDALTARQRRARGDVAASRLRLAVSSDTMYVTNLIKSGARRSARAAVEELGLRPHDVLSLLTTLQRDLTL